MKISGVLLILFFITGAVFSSTGDSLIELAKQHDIKRYEFAVEKGAKFINTADGKSFYILWMPEGFDTLETRTIVATIHGHASFATDEFFLWYQECQKRGFAIIALQWYFGGDERTSNYYQPNEMYPIFESVLRNENIKPGHCILHGFSRGSANTYGITAYDRHTKNNYFGLIISNAGSAEDDYPVNIEINKGNFGNMPYAGTHWVLYCGANDYNIHSDCNAMEKTEKWIMSLGGEVLLFIKDSSGDHGGFHKNKKNVSLAMDIYRETLSK